MILSNQAVIYYEIANNLIVSSDFSNSQSFLYV